jgi:sphingolipid 4-desaturase/C4-monooxygenase
MAKRHDFYYTEEKDIHFIRPIEIIKEHPEVRNYIGKNPYTFIAVTGLVLFQFGMAFMVKFLPWWGALIAAYVIGAFVVHALFVMVHECSHNLLFQRKQLNTLTGIFANSAMFFPSSVSFQRYHLKHHAHQGIHEFDMDLPSNTEAKVANNTVIGKAIWLLFYPIVQTLRLPRMKEIKHVDKWVLLNFVVVVGVDVAVWFLLGPISFIYIVASLFFSVGLHPLGARWVQEHFLTSDEVQETHSYYGPLNIVAFNVGYHNEHHDFPSVPWNKLPMVNKAGEKWYNGIASHNSWVSLWLRFLFDKNISIYSRMLRRRQEKPAKAK